MKKLKTILWLILLALLTFTSFTLDGHFQSKMNDLNLDHVLSNDDFLKVTVRDIIEESFVDDGFGGEVINIKLAVVITSSPLRGETLIFETQIHDPEVEVYPIEIGDRLLLNILDIEGELFYSIVTYQREQGLLWLFALFALSVILIGRFKGLRSLFALGFSIHVILRLLLPAILVYESLIWPAFILSVYILIGSFIIIGGLTSKTLHATTGSLIGITCSSLLAIFFLNSLRMSGILNEQSFFLLNVVGINIDLRGILFTSITIGSLGAIMDVSMSLASALDELKTSHPSIKDIVTSAFKISADMIATMTNTLILAYVGSSLGMLVLMAVYGQPSFFIFNSEFYAFEIMMGLIGSLGLILTLPATILLFVSTQWIRKGL